jgi:hypothetical protein
MTDIKHSKLLIFNGKNDLKDLKEKIYKEIGREGPWGKTQTQVLLSVKCLKPIAAINSLLEGNTWTEPLLPSKES